MLLDLDAFFASVEQLDHPEWRGKPVIVGGSPDKHGVVSTCSYEARTYGVRSAMPSSTARRLCPDAIWTEGNFHRYRELSSQIMDIILSFTPYVQQVSIDEAFADITPTRVNKDHPIDVVKSIQEEVCALGITCSIGLGTTKSVAKIASDLDKPKGLTIVYPGSEKSFLKDLPIKKLSGVGSTAERRLNDLGIFTLGDLSHAKESLLRSIFGIRADEMRARASGEDVSDIIIESPIKSISHEITFANDLENKDDINSALDTLLAQVGRRLRKKGIKGRSLHLKARFDDRTLHTAQERLPISTDDDIGLFPRAKALLERIWRPGIKIRLLGIGISVFTDDANDQDTLFDPDDPHVASDATSHVEEPFIVDKDKRRDLLAATDALKDRFGEDAVMRGSSFKNAGNDTGSSSKNPADYR